MSKKSPKKKPTAESTRKVEPAQKRKVIVFSSLLLVLGMTSALLLALENGRLRPDATRGLFAVENKGPVEPIYQTRVPVAGNRWKYIYVHQSATPAGDLASLSQAVGGLADHFFIGNGEGTDDGEIQVGDRWLNQSPAAPPAGANEIDPNCISICLVGDFHQNLPTPTQVQRLGELVNSLQGKFAISADRVLMITNQPNNRQVEIGRYFPTAAFRGQLVK